MVITDIDMVTDVMCVDHVLLVLGLGRHGEVEAIASKI